MTKQFQVNYFTTGRPVPESYKRDRELTVVVRKGLASYPCVHCGVTIPKGEPHHIDVTNGILRTHTTCGQVQ